MVVTNTGHCFIVVTWSYCVTVRSNQSPDAVYFIIRGVVPVILAKQIELDMTMPCVMESVMESVDGRLNPVSPKTWE